MNVVRQLISPQRAVYLLLVALLIALFILNPNFSDPGQIMRFIQRVAPVAIVAIGQYFVIVSGNLDLSQGSLITAQVIIAGNLVGQDPSKTIPVLLFMLAFGVLVGVFNGVITTYFKVPSFIVTLGTMLILIGGVMYWTGGAATGNPHDSFRQIGRGGIRDVPVLDFIPWSVLVLIGVTAIAVWVTKRPLGKTLVALGDSPIVAEYAGARTARSIISAFVISALCATVSAVLLVGFAGVHPSVGRGYEFTAITAVVLGGVSLAGGRGFVYGALAGAFVLEALFMLLNILGVPSTMRDSVQGVIIIAAVAYAAVTVSFRRSHPPDASDQLKTEALTPTTQGETP